jgi:phosphatidylglycerol---prolipoprotein diacylglyceryl transferase
MVPRHVRALIPYLEAPNWHLGPLPLGLFGVFAAAGITVAAEILVRQAKKRGLDPGPLAQYTPWGVGVGIATGHWVHLFFYHPEELAKSPLQALKIWDGLSSFGGLLGGILAAVVFFRWKKIPFRRYADSFALGIAPGWGIARVGCFVVHDHPGIRTDFFLAVQFPGGARHDLGLYDALVLFALSALLFALRNQSWFNGRLLPVLALGYGVPRFFLDFLRAWDLSYVDARHGNLTFAQFGALGLVAYGLWGLVVKNPSGNEPPPTTAAAS